MSKLIRLSPRYGVNPSMGVCFYCGEESGEIILPGELPDDAEAPRHAVWHKTPCPKCQTLMAQGIMLLGVRDGESGDNPYRTGKMAVVKESAMRHIVNDAELLADILKKRICYIEDSTWSKIGLPS